MSGDVRRAGRQHFLPPAGNIPLLDKRPEAFGAWIEAEAEAVQELPLVLLLEPL